MIKTIADLEDATEAEIKEAKKSFRFKERVTYQMNQMGKQTGLTLEEWEERVGKRKPEECPTCQGRGSVLPRLRTVGTIHASSATKCVTALYYDVTGEIAPKEELSIELQITFKIGHAIHNMLQHALHQVDDDDFDFDDEVKVDLPDAMIENGRADGEAETDLARGLLEIKTISGDDFSKLRGPKKEHLTQAVGLYAKGRDAPFVVFLYISKTWPHKIKEYVIEYDEKYFKEWYRKKGIKVENALDEGKPPKADASAYDCKSCSYGYACPQRLGMLDRFKR